MRPYRPSNRAPFLSVILLLIMSIAVGAAIGALLWAIEHYTHFYLVMLFPLFAGLIAGGVLALVVKSGKVRSPLLAALFGLIAGVAMYGVYHFGSYYLTFRGEARDALVEETGESYSDADLDAIINEVLREEVGDEGFVGYMKYAAQEGFSVTRTTASSSASAIEIKGTLAWIYWGIELLMAAILAAIGTGKAATEPFDESANQWYGPVQIIAATSLKSRKELVKALKTGDFEAAGRLLASQNGKDKRLNIGMRRSPDAASQDIYLVVKAQQGRNYSDIQKGLVTPSELKRLAQSLESARSMQIAS